jgi:hypothetical protein
VSPDVETHTLISPREELVILTSCILQLKGRAGSLIGEPVSIQGADPAQAATVKVSSCPAERVNVAVVYLALAVSRSHPYIACCA